MDVCTELSFEWMVSEHFPAIYVRTHQQQRSMRMTSNGGKENDNSSTANESESIATKAQIIVCYYEQQQAWC